MHTAHHRLAHLTVPGNAKGVQGPNHANPAEWGLGHRNLGSMESFDLSGRVLRGDLAGGYLAKNVLHVLIICHE
jgi:hypothetical protein